MGRELGVSQDTVESGIAAIQGVVPVVRNVVIAQAGEVEDNRESSGQDAKRAEAGRPVVRRATEVGLVAGIVSHGTEPSALGDTVEGDRISRHAGCDLARQLARPPHPVQQTIGERS
jgi:hypothetical protein